MHDKVNVVTQLKYIPSERFLANLETNKRLAAFESDGTQYLSIYGIVLLLGVYRGYAAQFVVERLNICYKVQKPMGRPTYCVKAKDWERVVKFIEDKLARKGVTVTPAAPVSATTIEAEAN